MIDSVSCMDGHHSSLFECNLYRQGSMRPPEVLSCYDGNRQDAAVFCYTTSKCDDNFFPANELYCIALYNNNNNNNGYF